MEWKEMLDKAIDYFQDNDGEFARCIEDLDSYMGYLDYEGRYYNMDFLDEYFSGSTATDILDSVDRYFNTNDYYFYQDPYGPVRSTDDKDYSDYLDRGFIEKLYEYKDKLQRYSGDLPEYINKLFEAYDEEDYEDEEDEE